MLKLINVLRSMEKLILNKSNITPIKLYITSNGGTTGDAFAANDAISIMKVPVYTYIIGYVYSSATILFLAGKKKYATKNATFGMHNPQAMRSNTGNAKELLTVVNYCNLVHKQLHNLYLNNTKIDSELINNYIDQDKHFDTEECLKLKIIDEIID